MPSYVQDDESPYRKYKHVQSRLQQQQNDDLNVRGGSIMMMERYKRGDYSRGVNTSISPDNDDLSKYQEMMQMQNVSEAHKLKPKRRLDRNSSMSHNTSMIEQPPVGSQASIDMPLYQR